MSDGIVRCAALACLEEPCTLLVFPSGVWPQEDRVVARDAMRDGSADELRAPISLADHPVPYCCDHAVVVARAYGAETYEPPEDVDLEELMQS